MSKKCTNKLEIKEVWRFKEVMEANKDDAQVLLENKNK